MAYVNIDRIYTKKDNVGYLKERIDYVINNDKTNDGELVSSYGCRPSIAHNEWDFSRDLYHEKNNNSLPPDDKPEVMAYRVIQSFKGYEVDYETANKIGYELAMKLTQGNHAFIVSTHIDTGNIHNHITWNAFEKEGNGKFNNVHNSWNAVAIASNELSKKYGLSIINETHQNLSKDYGTWLDLKGITKPRTQTEKIKVAVDEILEENPKDFEELVRKLRLKGFEVKVRNRKHISIRCDGNDNFRRLNTIGGDYTQNKLIERLTNPNQNGKSNSNKKLQVMIDVEQALAEKGRGYQIWAERHNTNQLIQTMNYMYDNKLNTYDDLVHKINEEKEKFQENRSELDDIKNKMKENEKIQQAIRDYSKAKPVYNDYKNSGYSKKFKSEHIDSITKFENAKQVYKELGKGGKLPTMEELRNEWAELNMEKNYYLEGNGSGDGEMQQMLNAKTNLETILNKNPSKNIEENDKKIEIEEQKKGEEIENDNKKRNDKTER